MQTALESIQGGLSFNFDIVDVDAQPELEARYGEWVPVLLDGEVEICHYVLDQAKLVEYLERKSV
jgi:Glutaredoxin-like domain (DUF836)